jgi:hypothetical protein
MPIADTKEKEQAMSECWSCIHRRSIPGDAHISCIKPDPQMTGHPHGVRNGWFLYPINFDPVWKAKLCANYEAKEKAINA